MPITEGAGAGLDTLPPGATGTLTIDLGAVAANWIQLRRLMGESGDCAAVVKADAYGLGMAAIAPALADAGCRTFFVATLDEGLTLRKVLGHHTAARIAILDGPPPGAAREIAATGLIPVLNAPGQVREWLEQTEHAPAILQLDTGMSRLGMSATELDRLAADGELSRLNLLYVMSHLACADTPAHPLNRAQLDTFQQLAARFPAVKRSLAASSGIFLGAGYRFDLARPGAALWGLNPTPEHPNPMRQVVSLKGKILQVLEIDDGRCVGYGATHKASGPTRIATVGVGYADGYMRAGGNRAHAFRGSVALPVVGRISMDLISLDVTALPIEHSVPGTWIDLLGPAYSADDLARDCGTNGYEILTRLSHRLHRTYIR